MVSGLVRSFNIVPEIQLYMLYCTTSEGVNIGKHNRSFTCLSLYSFAHFFGLGILWLTIPAGSGKGQDPFEGVFGSSAGFARCGRSQALVV